MRGGGNTAERMDTTAAAPAPKDWAIIRIAASTSAADQDPVLVGANNDRNWIKRGAYTPVTRGQVNVLRDAQYPVYSNEPGEDRRKVLSYVERFPHTVVKWIGETSYRRLKAIALKRELTQAEIDAAE